ncbi:uncharacterized protein B0I36DRAFT_434656 [Microdochium trichocladiopsis]|uniref:Uncharacterized protein n=1 Tax=Microdochium trichocladiopsis TaxID=1682393 RepID=A0A9P8XYM5_9PEZI|nr:uncharacterized protein B0I36DRAFT_434656 [Microdochium trichocladiopsis]KAH7025201.1 hypothetical protein B0I36DRAFT_434656 [Microdochium trichocladiopsis]
METLYTIILHRKEGLNELKGNRERQQSGQLVPDKDKIGAPKDIEIAIEDPDGQVFEKASLVFSVIEVIPRDGEPLHRNYVSKNGLPSTHPLPNYTIEDPKAVFEALVARSETHALPWAKSSHGSYPMKIFVKLHEEKRTKYHDRLPLLVEYDFGTHFKTGSGFIISEEKLGIQPLPWDAERLAGKCPTPRLATGAVDKIEDGRMEELLKKVRDLFWEILLDRSAMGLYLANLIVVGWAYRSEVVLKDRNRRAREKGQEAIPKQSWVGAIEESMEVAINLLMLKAKMQNITRADMIKDKEVGEDRVIGLEKWVGEKDWAEDHAWKVPSCEEIWGGLVPSMITPTGSVETLSMPSTGCSDWNFFNKASS